MPAMFRLPALALAIALVAAMGPAPAAAQGFDVTNMTPAERASFQEEIRAFLMENPEVIFEAVAVFEQRQAESQASRDMTLIQMNGQAIFDDGHSWVGGNPDGDITLVEFVDYRCGFCRRAFDEVMALLGEDRNIRFIVKEFPILGTQSELASRFAISVLQTAGDAAYEEVHARLLMHEGDITPSGLRRMAADMAAEGFSVDADAVMLRMDSPSVTDVIRENRLLAQRLGINGTPTFILEDEMIRGFVPQSALAMIIADMRSDG